MADKRAIERIAKMLAGATSPEPAEAESKLRGAYLRMVRDSVSLEDLLTLPQEDLYQDTLVRLVEVILADTQDISPSNRRRAYSEYMWMIAQKFPADGAQSPGRDAEASNYWKRNGYEDFESKNTNADKQEYVKPNKHNNVLRIYLKT